jgi:hypothetical protein
MILRFSPPGVGFELALAQPLAHVEHPGLAFAANIATARRTIVAAAPSAITETVRSWRSPLMGVLPW